MQIFAPIFIAYFSNILLNNKLPDGSYVQSGIRKKTNLQFKLLAIVINIR